MSEPASRLVGYTDARLSYLLPELKAVIDSVGILSKEDESFADLCHVYKELQELHTRIQEG